MSHNKFCCAACCNAVVCLSAYVMLLCVHCRSQVIEADNREFWEAMVAKLTSMQQQPSSSQQATEVGDALAALQHLLLEDNVVDLYDYDYEGADN
jgi:hypothetical protein